MAYRHRSAKQVMKKNQLLHALAQHSAHLQALQEEVSMALLQCGLPSESISVIRYQSGILKLQLPNQSLATRFRFMEPKLLVSLKQRLAFSHLEKIVVRVASAQQQSKSESRKVERLSNENAQLIGQTACQCDDEKLKAALKRLSRNIQS